MTSFVTGVTGQTAAGAEFTQQDINVAGVFVVEVDTTLMAAGDVVELRIYSLVPMAGTLRVVYYMPFYGAQDADDRLKISMPVSNNLTDAASLRFTVKQPFGTTRAMPYKIVQHA